MTSEPGKQPSPDWNFYKNPRHPYDDFVIHYLLKPLKYTIIRKHYNRPLAAFVHELPELMHRFSTVFGPGGTAWLAETIARIEQAGIHDLYAFLDRVSTRAQAETFLKVSGIPKPSLMGWMDYLKQWWFPYPASLLQVVEEDNPRLKPALAQMKAVKIANGFTLLEAAAEPGGRSELSRRVGIEAEVLLDLVHRADVSRLPYTSGGAVKRLWAMGYRSLDDIRRADPQDYAARVEAYFAAGGKGFAFDAKMPNILSFLQDARHAPQVVKIG